MRASLAVSVLSTVALIAVGPWISTTPALVLLAASFAGYAILLRSEARAPTLKPGLAIAACVGLLAVAVAIPPRDSKDIWSYAIHGRMIARYHASPYEHAPSEFASDPLYPRVSTRWLETRSVYGPAFAGVEAAGIWLAGASPLRARLFFQSIAALAMLAALLLVWRRTRDPAAVACLGLNPTVVVHVVNSGHNDALLGVLVLGGALAAPGHAALAGALLGLAASVKVVGLFPLAAVAAWAWIRRGRRAGVTLAASGLAVTAITHLAAGGAAVVRALGEASLQVSRVSIWNIWRRHPGDSILSAGVSRVALALVVLAGIAVVAAKLRDGSPEILASASLVPYLIAGTYILPWYPVWVLPALALRWRRKINVLMIAQGAALFTVYLDRYPSARSVMDPVLRAVGRTLVPALEIAVAVALLRHAFRTLRGRRAAAPGEAQGRPADRRSSDRLTIGQSDAHQ